MSEGNPMEHVLNTDSCLLDNPSGRSERPASLTKEEAAEHVVFLAHMQERRVAQEYVVEAEKADDGTLGGTPVTISSKTYGEMTEREMPTLYSLYRDAEGVYEQPPPLTAAELAAEQRLGVGAPIWNGIFQARAASRMRRGPEQITQILWHTPEGSEAGTLSVLNGGGAGFDVFIPTNGKLYKCNDWWNFVAWQAGHWDTNLRSIGVEMGDYASRSGDWPESFYDTLAYVCAFLGEVCGVPIRNSRGIGDPGYVDHAEITPGWRTDPGVGFRRELVLQKIADIRGGRFTPPTPAKPVKPEYVYWLYPGDGTQAARLAKAAVSALHDAGFSKTGAFHKPADCRWASYRALKGTLGQFLCCVIGDGTLPLLQTTARENCRDSTGKWYSTDISDLWDITGSSESAYNKARWRLAEISRRLAPLLDSSKVLKSFDEYSGKTKMFHGRNR